MNLFTPDMIRNISKKSLSILLSLFIVAVPFAIDVSQTSALGNLSVVSIQPSDGRPSATGVTYLVGFTFPDTSAIQCIQVKFATTSGMGTPATGMTTASGFSLTGGGLTQGNWSNYGSASNGTIQIDAGSNQTPTATAATITWTGVTNTSITNPTNIYAQITTYSTNTSHTCTGAVHQSAVTAMVFTTGVTTTVSVDPTLTFTVANDGSAVNGSGDSGFVTTTASTIPFGTVAGGSYGAGSQTLTTATNAANGYTDYVSYTQALTDANSDTIADTTGTNSSPGSFSGSTSVSAFGYTEDGPGESQFTSNTWAKVRTVQDAIATRSTPQAGDAFHVEYKVEPSNTQAPGSYSTTIIYTAVPTY